jgi:hypothetical protein
MTRSGSSSERVPHRTRAAAELHIVCTHGEGREVTHFLPYLLDPPGVVGVVRGTSLQGGRRDPESQPKDGERAPDGHGRQRLDCPECGQCTPVRDDRLKALLEKIAEHDGERVVTVELRRLATLL